jgi:hypothetical protein
LELEWTNLILGCINCNSTKGTTNPDRNGYLWPDQDNTFEAFDYSEGSVSVNENQFPAQKRMAQELFKLVGLGRRPGVPGLSHVDRRWKKRDEAWGMAQEYREDYERGAVTLNVIGDVAALKGFWSVWMTVFADLAEVRRFLVDRFPGTNRAYFPHPP